MLGFSVWWWLFLALFIVAAIVSRTFPKGAFFIALAADIVGVIVLSNLYWGWSGRGGMEIFFGRALCLARLVGVWSMVKDRQLTLWKSTAAVFYGFIILADHFALMSLISGTIAISSIYYVGSRVEEKA